MTPITPDEAKGSAAPRSILTFEALDLSTISRPRGNTTEQDVVSCLPSDYQEVLRNKLDI